MFALHFSRHSSASWGPAFYLHVLQERRGASFRWYGGENGELISTDLPPLYSNQHVIERTLLQYAKYGQQKLFRRPLFPCDLTRRKQ
jgi:hypothetical protein